MEDKADYRTESVVGPSKAARVAAKGARTDRIRQLIFVVRHPEKPEGYDAQRVAEELADLLEEQCR